MSDFTEDLLYGVWSVAIMILVSMYGFIFAYDIELAGPTIGNVAGLITGMAAMVGVGGLLIKCSIEMKN